MHVLDFVARMDRRAAYGADVFLDGLILGPIVGHTLLGGCTVQQSLAGWLTDAVDDTSIAKFGYLLGSKGHIRSASHF